MHHEGLGCAAGAFHNGLAAFHKVQHIHAAVGVVRHRAGEPVAACLDELQFAQPCAFLAPAIARGQRLHAVDERTPHPIRGAVPLDVFHAMLEMNGPRPPVESGAPPVP
ncbi:MAG: hypothetical protein ABSA42_01830 [Terracidiphilus sp.]